ncbi:MAG: hypothetical protein KGL39_17400 [Patescibacteria group bacterium]|nr:hypothetical protein [Patescibacteria group bacterium]
MADPADWVERAEAATLGSLLLEPSNVPIVGAIIEPRDFRTEPHRAIFGALTEMAAAGEGIGFDTVAARLEKRGKLDAAGGIAYLMRLLNETPTAAHAEDRAREVKRASEARKHSALAIKWAAKAKSADYDPDANAGELVRILTAHSEARKMRTIADVMLETMTDADSPHPPIRTGIMGLDALFAGLDRGMVAVVLAKPGVGKTALGMQLVTSEARGGAYCQIFSAEMAGTSLGYRWLAHATGVDRQWIWANGQARNVSEDDELRWKAISSATESYSTIGPRLMIDDTSQISIDLLVMRAHLADRLARQHQADHGIEQTGLDTILVDYLQLLRGSQDAKDGETREMQVTAASQALVALAKSLDCRIVLIASLSNSGTTRYSGGVDYDVDIRVTLDPADDGDPEHLIARVTKSRDGPKGDIHLRYIGARYEYRDYGAAPNPDPPPDRSQGRRVAEER